MCRQDIVLLDLHANLSHILSGNHLVQSDIYIPQGHTTQKAQQQESHVWGFGQDLTTMGYSWPQISPKALGVPAALSVPAEVYNPATLFPKQFPRFGKVFLIIMYNHPVPFKVVSLLQSMYKPIFGKVSCIKPKLDISKLCRQCFRSEKVGKSYASRLSPSLFPPFFLYPPAQSHIHVHVAEKRLSRCLHT